MLMPFICVLNKDFLTFKVPTSKNSLFEEDAHIYLISGFVFFHLPSFGLLSWQHQLFIKWNVEYQTVCVHMCDCVCAHMSFVNIMQMW